VDTDVHNNVNAIINGLFGAMAMLYGEGDFFKTVGIAVSSGLDCDNQAATVGGFIGVLNGLEFIPRHLTTDMGGGEVWIEPFNNQYINYSRDKLPNMTPISEIIDRIYAMAEIAILENGGKKLRDNGAVILQIPVK
ncbi:MAG TPA: ADP-ribosylglycohydrolase family protein, partial [Cyclobacteriaceae bacterium]